MSLHMQTAGLEEAHNPDARKRPSYVYRCERCDYSEIHDQPIQPACGKRSGDRR
jgi:hypothetical protein